MITSPGDISLRYKRGVYPDGMGNPLRLLHSPLSSNEEKATHELFRLGMLHRLDVSAYVARGGSVDFSVYFAPFHMPGVATSQLSPDAIALKDSLP